MLVPVQVPLVILAGLSKTVNNHPTENFRNQKFMCREPISVDRSSGSLVPKHLSCPPPHLFKLHLITFAWDEQIHIHCGIVTWTDRGLQYRGTIIYMTASIVERLES